MSVVSISSLEGKMTSIYSMVDKYRIMTVLKVETDIIPREEEGVKGVII
jgi:hypothetical protein